MKKLLQKIICWAYPQLYLFKSNESDLNRLRSWEYHTEKEDHVKIEPKYNISDSKIGRYTYISYNSYISMTTIGRFCSIGPNLLCGYGKHPLDGISTHPMFYSTLKQNGVTLCDVNKFKEHEPISIGNDVFIGANVTILDGVSIGDGAVIGAGSVVSKDIPPYAIAYGAPIKISRYRFSEKQISALQRIKWWNFDETALGDIEKMFYDIDGFIQKYDQQR